MPDFLIIGIAALVFVALLMAGHYVHSVLLISGTIGLVLLDGTGILNGLLGPQPFSRTASYSLTTIPLFVLMAQFILQADIVKDLFYVVNRLSRRRKGVLGSLTLVTGAMLGAVSGSGTASAASLGQVAVPELEKSGIKPALAGAVAAAAGSMSGIIPPSIILILYGVATETPIGDLFIAAIIPGLMVMVVFIVVMLVYLRRAEISAVDEVLSTALPEKISPWRIFVSMTIGSLIVVVVFGGIYAGVFTPTEAGAVGAFAGFIAALVLGKVNFSYLRVCFLETVKVTVMVMLILIAAQVFGRFVSLSLIPRRIIEALEPLVDTPLLMLVVLGLIFLVLFMFIEGAAVILMTIPVVFPIVVAMDTDVVWFGVFVAVICTVGMITPPVGLSVFAVSGATRIPSGAIFGYTTVFAVLATVLVVAVMILFPQVATWLPSLMR